jgi:hypothetical protein
VEVQKEQVEYLEYRAKIGAQKLCRSLPGGESVLGSGYQERLFDRVFDAFVSQNPIAERDFEHFVHSVIFFEARNIRNLVVRRGYLDLEFRGYCSAGDDCSDFYCRQLEARSDIELLRKRLSKWDLALISIFLEYEKVRPAAKAWAQQRAAEGKFPRGRNWCAYQIRRSIRRAREILGE